MHRPSRRTLLSLVAALVAGVPLLGACQSVQSNADYDEATDFTLYKTYAWLPQVPNPVASEIVIGRIQAAVDAQLVAKGLKLVPAAQADLMVTQKVSVQEKLQVNDPYYAYQAYQTYEEGTLLIDLVDSKTRKLVWRGTGQTRLSEYKNPDDRSARVQKVVDAVLKQYPPQ